MSEERIEILAKVIKDTDNSFLLSAKGGDYQWVTKSMVDHSPDPQPGETIVFEMPKWLATEKGFA